MRDLIDRGLTLVGPPTEESDETLAEDVGGAAFDDPSFTSAYPHVPEATPGPVDEIYYTGLQNLGGPTNAPHRAVEPDDLPTQPYATGYPTLANANLSNAVMYLRQAYEFLQVASRHCPPGSPAKAPLADLYAKVFGIHNEALNLAKDVNAG